MSQTNVLKGFRLTVSWDLDFREKIHHDLMFMSKVIIQIVTFFIILWCDVDHSKAKG